MDTQTFRNLTKPDKASHSLASEFKTTNKTEERSKASDRTTQVVSITHSTCQAQEPPKRDFSIRRRWVSGKTRCFKSDLAKFRKANRQISNETTT